MDHIRAICEALDLSADEVMGRRPQEAKTALEQRMLTILRDLGQAEAEVLLMTGEVMRRASAPKT